MLIFFFFFDRNENPAVKKGIVAVVAERPKEAPASALQQLLYERGVAMECWISSL